MRAIAKCGGNLPAKATLAAVFIFGFVISSFFASNPILHHWLHHDAEHSTHHCPISVVEKQQVLAADPELEVNSASIRFYYSDSVSDDVWFPTTIYNASLGRAPPA